MDYTISSKRTRRMAQSLPNVVPEVSVVKVTGSTSVTGSRSVTGTKVMK